MDTKQNGTDGAAREKSRLEKLYEERNRIEAEINAAEGLPPFGIGPTAPEHIDGMARRMFLNIRRDLKELERLTRWSTLTFGRPGDPQSRPIV